MMRMFLGCCLAIAGEDGKNGCPVVIGMVIEVEKNPRELIVDDWEVERNDGKRNWGEN
jgi:hypothetical protein